MKRTTTTTTTTTVVEETTPSLTRTESEVIRSVAALNEWQDVCGIGEEIVGRPLTKNEAWAAGRAAANLWADLTGLSHPSYALMPKRSTGKDYAAHLKAVYPPSWHERIATVVRSVVSRNAVANGFTEYGTPPTEHPLEGTLLHEMFGGTDATCS